MTAEVMAKPERAPRGHNGISPVVRKLRDRETRYHASAGVFGWKHDMLITAPNGHGITRPSVVANRLRDARAILQRVAQRSGLVLYGSFGSLVIQAAQVGNGAIILGRLIVAEHRYGA